MPDQDRFSIVWNQSMGCYRVSIPNFLPNDGDRMEVVPAEVFDRLVRTVEILIPGSTVFPDGTVVT